MRKISQDRVKNNIEIFKKILKEININVKMKMQLWQMEDSTWG